MLAGKPRRWLFLSLFGGLLMLSGCAVAPPPADDAKPQIAGDSCVGERKLPLADYSAAATDADLSFAESADCSECQVAEAGDRDPSVLFQLAGKTNQSNELGSRHDDVFV